MNINLYKGKQFHTYGNGIVEFVEQKGENYYCFKIIKEIDEEYKNVFIENHYICTIYQTVTYNVHNNRLIYERQDKYNKALIAMDIKYISIKEKLDLL